MKPHKWIFITRQLPWGTIFGNTKSWKILPSGGAYAGSSSEISLCVDYHRRLYMYLIAGKTLSWRIKKYKLFANTASSLPVETANSPQSRQSFNPLFLGAFREKALEKKATLRYGRPRDTLVKLFEKVT